MARFTGRIEGAKVNAKDFEGSEEGLSLMLQGQNNGVRVRARIEQGRDVLEIWQDWGWAGTKQEVMIGIVTSGRFIRR